MRISHLQFSSLPAFLINILDIFGTLLYHQKHDKGLLILTPKKKILFVHPLGENSKPGDQNITRVINIMPPLGLLSLAAWIEKHGHQTEVHDCYAFPGMDDKIYRYLKKSGLILSVSPQPRPAFWTAFVWPGKQRKFFILLRLFLAVFICRLCANSFCEIFL